MKPLKPDGVVDCSRCAGFDVTKGDYVSCKDVREWIENVEQWLEFTKLLHGYYYINTFQPRINELKKLLEAKDED